MLQKYLKFHQFLSTDLEIGLTELTACGTNCQTKQGEDAFRDSARSAQRVIRRETSLERGILNDIHVARSAPVLLFRRIASQMSLSTAGEFSGELLKFLGVGSRAANVLPARDENEQFWESDAVVLLDANVASVLIADESKLRQIAFATKRLFVFPIVPRKTEAVSFFYSNDFCPLATLGDDTWTWCYSEDGTAFVEIFSYLSTPTKATLSFRVVTSEITTTPLLVDGVGVAVNAAHECNVILQPGLNTVSFKFGELSLGSVYGGRRYHFAIYNLAAVIDGYGKSDSNEGSLGVRRALHRAGFNYVSTAILPYSAATERLTPFSQGNYYEPDPYMLDDLSVHRGERVDDGSVLWFCCVQRHTDLGMFAREP